MLDRTAKENARSIGDLCAPSSASLLVVLAADGTRYGIAPDLKTYPQATAKETLASVIKAVEDKRVDYVVAQLADPAFVDDRVKRLYGGRFEQQVEDTRARLDPLTIKQLQRFLKDGDWQRRQGSRDRAAEGRQAMPVFSRRATAAGTWSTPANPKVSDASQKRPLRRFCEASLTESDL